MFVIRTPSEIRALERKLVDLGYAEAALIEAVAGNAAERLRRLVRDLPAGAHLVALVGPGHNGADGLAIVRRLLLRDVRAPRALVVCLGATSRPAVDVQLRLLEYEHRARVDVCDAGSDEARAALAKLSRARGPVVVIDALFGLGYEPRSLAARPPIAHLASTLAWLAERRERALPTRVYAIDVVSGLSADGTSDAAFSALVADASLCVVGPKPAQVESEIGVQRSGRLLPIDMGVSGLAGEATPFESLFVRPRLSSLRAMSARLFALDSLTVPKLARVAHKGTRGRVLVFGGVPASSGAPWLTGEAALRFGAGYAAIVDTGAGSAAKTVAGPERPRVSEVVVRAPDDESWATLGREDFLVFGPGLPAYGAPSPQRLGFLEADFLKAAFAQSTVPLLIDGGGLARALDWLRQNVPAGLLTGAPFLVLTPHPKEAADMLEVLSSDRPEAEIYGHRFEFFEKLRKELELFGAHGLLLLKGAYPIFGLFGFPNKRHRVVFDVADGRLGTAGMGDVVSGAIAGAWLRLRDVPAAPEDRALLALAAVHASLARGGRGAAAALASDIGAEAARAFARLLAKLEPT